MIICSEPVDFWKYRGLLARLIGWSFFFQVIVGVRYPPPLHSNSTVSFTNALVSFGGMSIHTGKDKNGEKRKTSLKVLCLKKKTHKSLLFYQGSTFPSCGAFDQFVHAFAWRGP